MSTAFVTGATGFLGLNLVEQLTRQGWRVTALHRRRSNVARLAPFEPALAEGDILDRDSLEAAIPSNVDAVFHVAASTSVWSRRNERQTRANVGGTRNVLAAALSRGARRFVHTSTWNTFGLEHAEISEDTPQTGGSSWINYNRSKTMAERAVRRAVGEGLDAVIVNPAHIVGRYDTNGWARMIRLAAAGKLPGVPPGSGSFCHAEQVALAEIAAAERGATGENYLLGGTDASFVELVGIVGELTSRAVPKKPVPAWLLHLTARLSAGAALVTGREPAVTPEGVAMVTVHPRIVSDKAARVLGYRSVPLRHMLEDAVGWLKAEGLV